MELQIAVFKLIGGGGPSSSRGTFADLSLGNSLIHGLGWESKSHLIRTTGSSPSFITTRNSRSLFVGCVGSLALNPKLGPTTFVSTEIRGINALPFWEDGQ